MPKKGGKGKQVQSPEVIKKPQQDGSLPQVWLPDQPMSDIEDESAPPTNLPSPSQDEQDRMAQLWALEESTSPRNWDDDQELDYSEIAKKRGIPEEDLDSSGNSGQVTGNPDLFRYAQSSVFNLKYLGHIRDLCQEVAESQTKTLAAIDTAQKQGILPWVTSDSSQRTLSLSKYGFKVTDMKRQRVYMRHPLHWIANITYYEDNYGRHMLVLRQSKPERHATYEDLFIYECDAEGQAKDICLTLAQAFEAVHSKIKLVQNLHSSELR